MNGNVDFLCVKGLGRVKNLHKINSIEIYYLDHCAHYSAQFSFNQVDYDLLMEVFNYHISRISEYSLLDIFTQKLNPCDFRKVDYFMIKSNNYKLYEMIYYIPFLNTKSTDYSVFSVEDSIRLNMYKK